jgi:hypothetical protein
MTPKKIRQGKGPSKWDVILAFFENREVMFTLMDGTVVTLDGIDALIQHTAYDTLEDPSWYGEDVSCGTKEAWLITGRCVETGEEAFIEYLPLSRSGLCVLATDIQSSQHWQPQTAWSRIMGITGYPYNPIPE